MKVFEWIKFCHPGTLQTRSARLKQNPSDTAESVKSALLYIKRYFSALLVKRHKRLSVAGICYFHNKDRDFKCTLSLFCFLFLTGKRHKNISDAFSSTLVVLKVSLSFLFFR